MPLMNELMSAVGSGIRILRVAAPARGRLLRDFVRIQFNYIALNRLSGRRPTSERFLGYTLHFAHYGQLATLFDEIFAPHVYRFTPVRPDPLIIDCGANIGMSVLYFKWMYPQSRIVAFEPDPATFELLRWNVEENGLADVELRCEAVGGASGPVPFYYVEDVPGWLAQSTVTRASLEAKTRSVPMVTLSQFISGEVDLLKVDTEGCETATLAELEASGKLRSIRAIVLEYHHHMQKGDDCLSAFLAVLERNGFGYQISANLRPPFVSGEFQGLMIGAYRKQPGQPLPLF